ncbi:hypothetical protein ACN28I_20465 [Archangium gephyra]|uniref:hypothetical protein n=1 Tax=Archangium gephyra TaxID=48 RepID=UPI003B777B11
MASDLPVQATRPSFSNDTTATRGVSLHSEILQVKQTDPGLEGLCLRLERMVTEHVSQEESALLPKVQSLANEEDLDSMSEDMQQAIDQWRNTELLRMAEHQESLPPSV